MSVCVYVSNAALKVLKCTNLFLNLDRFTISHTLLVMPVPSISEKTPPFSCDRKYNL